MAAAPTVAPAADGRVVLATPCCVAHPKAALVEHKSKRGVPFISCPMSPHPSNPNPKKQRVSGPVECTFVYGRREVMKWREQNLPQQPSSKQRPQRDGPFEVVRRSTRGRPLAEAVGLRMREDKGSANLKELLELADTDEAQ